MSLTSTQIKRLAAATGSTAVVIGVVSSAMAGASPDPSSETTVAACMLVNSSMSNSTDGHRLCW